jgi:No apical meristem-associated C-terminal domain
VKEWNPFFKRIVELPPSGTTIDDWIRMASEVYNEHNGRRFNFEHSVEILHHIPKFDPMIVDNSDSDEGVLEKEGKPVAINNTTVAVASKLERPIGNKKAKQLERDDKSFAALLKEQQDNRTKIAVSNEHIANALKERNRMKSQQMKINNQAFFGWKPKELFHVADLYCTIKL